MAEKGRRGTRVKTPARLKVIEGRGNGRDSGGRVITQPPAFKRLPPDKPEGMSEVASTHWDRLVDELARLELLKPVDGGALEMACEAYARWHAAREFRLRNGILGANSQGTIRNPAVVVEEAAEKAYRAWCHEFGMTPAAESALVPPESNDADDNPFASQG